MSIHQLIKLKRVERGYTQRQLADKLNVPQSTIYRWEKAIQKPKINNLIKLNAVLELNLSIGDLKHEKED